MIATTQDEFAGLRRAGMAVARTLQAMKGATREGVTTGELDQVAERVMTEAGARSAPRLIYNFPGATCISVNEEAVHGIPGDRKLQRGDIVTLDVVLELEGYFADAALTIGVGPVSEEARRLMSAAEQAFYKAAKRARAGEKLSTLGGVIEVSVVASRCKVLREICGHGIGRSLHEEPQVLNYYHARDPRRLEAGLVLAVEPIISLSTHETRTLDDGWTVVSSDGSLCAHYEHTLIVTKGQPVFVTAPEDR